MEIIKYKVYLWCVSSVDKVWSVVSHFPTSKQHQNIQENTMNDDLKEFLTNLENNEDAYEGLDLFDEQVMTLTLTKV